MFCLVLCKKHSQEVMGGKHGIVLPTCHMNTPMLTMGQHFLGKPMVGVAYLSQLAGPRSKTIAKRGYPRDRVGMKIGYPRNPTLDPFPGWWLTYPSEKLWSERQLR